MKRSKPASPTLGRDYFRSEANFHFVSELVVFAILTMASALPLLNGLTAVVDLLR
jgi:hypothetical protein